MVRTYFSSDFLTFRNFRPQFRESYSASGRLKWELRDASEKAIHYEKIVKTASKSTHITWCNFCSKYITLEWTGRQTLSVTVKTWNKSITSKAMQYRQDIDTRTHITRVKLITISIVTIRSIWHNSAADFLPFGKFLQQICESCAPCTDGTTKRLVRCKGHLIL